MLKISDLVIGQKVVHLSNNNLIMVITKIDNENKTVTCRWIDNTGKVVVNSFIIEELSLPSSLGGVTLA